MNHIESQERRVRENMKAAIASMRNALDDAERRMNHGTLDYAVQQVTHALSWGHVNAMNGMTTAMAALEDFNAAKREVDCEEILALNARIKELEREAAK